jgi:hypothetical protein
MGNCFLLLRKKTRLSPSPSWVRRALRAIWKMSCCAWWGMGDFWLGIEGFGTKT